MGQYKGDDIYKDVIAAMQNAEEAGGPEGQDYVDLMAEDRRRGDRARGDVRPSPQAQEALGAPRRRVVCPPRSVQPRKRRHGRAQPQRRGCAPGVVRELRRVLRRRRWPERDRVAHDHGRGRPRVHRRPRRDQRGTDRAGGGRGGAVTTAKLAPDQALAQIAALLSDKAGTWNATTANRVAEIVVEAGFSLEATAPETKEEVLKCPHCGCTDADEITVVETYRASHPVTGYNEDGVFVLVNALGTTCPSEHFDDGDG